MISLQLPMNVPSPFSAGWEASGDAVEIPLTWIIAVLSQDFRLGACAPSINVLIQCAHPIFPRTLFVSKEG